jgi:hypothetical protein
MRERECEKESVSGDRVGDSPNKNIEQEPERGRVFSKL